MGGHWSTGVLYLTIERYVVTFRAQTRPQVDQATFYTMSKLNTLSLLPISLQRVILVPEFNVSAQLLPLLPPRAQH